MSLDESGTLANLQAHRSELIVPAIARHRGLVVKLMGDGILAEFGGAAVTRAPERAPANLQQEIRYCRARDGVRLAYALVGRGPPLVRAPTWLNHLEYDWQSPLWRHILRRFASEHTLIRADARGNGLSDWEVDEISFELWVSDLETVIDQIGLPRFPLFDVSQGCAISLAYAGRHPER